MLQFYEAVCLHRCQAFQYAGEHPRTSQALWLWCQHTGTLICLCEHEWERKREWEIEERRKRTVVCGFKNRIPCSRRVCVRVHMVSLSITTFIFQLKTSALSQGSSSHINPPPPLFCSLWEKSLVIIMTHTHNAKPHWYVFSRLGESVGDGQWSLCVCASLCVHQRAFCSVIIRDRPSPLSKTSTRGLLF